MNTTRLSLDGITIVPLRRVSSDTLLEGWLHYEQGSYRYYRWCPGPVRLVLRHKGEEQVSFHEGYTPSELELRPFEQAQFGRPSADPRAQDSFTEAAIVVKGEGAHPWKYKVHAVFDCIPAVDGEAATRAEAVSEADKVLSKFLVQDVHDDPVDLQSIAQEVDTLRMMLSILVYDERDSGRADAPGEKINLRVTKGSVESALRLLGLRKIDEQAAK